MIDFSGEMQTMNNDLTQKGGCVAGVIGSHIAAGIVEKWWRQHVSDFDGAAIQAPGLELQGERLG